MTGEGFYTARRTSGGEVIVLAPDGLTWETNPGQIPTLESAQSYALALNEWLDQRPDPSKVSPFFNPTIDKEPTVTDLLCAIDRLYNAEDRLDLLVETLRNYNPQEEQVG